MNIDDFGTLFATGHTLSLEERAVLEVQLAKKQQEDKLHSMRFWGRITGTTADYLIVAGTLSTSELPARKWFYATSKDLTLLQLPLPTPEVVTQAAAVASSRFVGNPAALLGADAEAGEEEEGEAGEEEVDEEGNPKPRKPRFTEAHRVAATVALLEVECGVVPVGAYAVTATRHVTPSPAFAGVPASSATSLAAWAHFRPPRNPVRAATLAKAAAVPGTADFLDPLSEDAPAACWAATVDAGRGVARVASLRFPGYFAFATVSAGGGGEGGGAGGKWGSVYVGDGRAEEIQWML